VISVCGQVLCWPSLVVAPRRISEKGEVKLKHCADRLKKDRLVTTERDFGLQREEEVNGSAESGFGWLKKNTDTTTKTVGRLRAYRTSSSNLSLRKSATVAPCSRPERIARGRVIILAVARRRMNRRPHRGPRPDPIPPPKRQEAGAPLPLRLGQQ
jgi:hypothetical protein